LLTVLLLNLWFKVLVVASFQTNVWEQTGRPVRLYERQTNIFRQIKFAIDDSAARVAYYTPARAAIPEPSVLKADIDALENWVAGIRKRRGN
jgi:hypothetical protein